MKYLYPPAICPGYACLYSAATVHAPGPGSYLYHIYTIPRATLVVDSP